MAEWTGQKRTLNSIPVEDDPPLDDTSVHVPRTPQAPAATTSPQLPGMTPDQPARPGEGSPGGPAIIPEPYPPPDEGNPPEPAIMPEPGPLAPEEPKEGRRGA